VDALESGDGRGDEKVGKKRRTGKDNDTFLRPLGIEKNILLSGSREGG